MAGTGEDGILISSIYTTILEAEPSCIEFAQEGEGIFVVGFYTLHSQSQTLANEEAGTAQVRTGGLSVFRLVNKSGVSLLKTHAIDAAVLDCHFCTANKNILGAAQSNGVLSIWRLQTLGDRVELQHLHDLVLGNFTDLVLALAWCPDPSRYTVAATMSDGSIMVLELDDDWHQKTTEKQCVAKSQRLEAWTLAWSAKPAAMADRGAAVEGSQWEIYCGGDDAVICRWDVETLQQREHDQQLEGERFLEVEVPEQRIKGTMPYSGPGLLFDASTHGAGVTAILPLWSPEDDAEILITGSYDESLRVLLPKPLGRWRVLAERSLGGGVWRLKMLSKTTTPHGLLVLVLASCMHAGSRVVRIERNSGDSWSVSVVARFEEHQSMNYGSDTFELSPGSTGESHIVVSTSFYDKRLCVWTTGG